MRTRAHLSASTKGALIYIAAVIAVIVVHSVALYFDRASEDDPRTRATTQHQA